MSNNRISQIDAFARQQDELVYLQEKYKGLQPWQVKARSPEDYSKLFEQEDVDTGLQGADKNFATDFLGNLVWTAGEELTLGATTALDLWSGKDIKEEFGVDEWAENSWAGRIGGIAGQGIGFISGLKYLGMGLGAASKAINFGSKALTKGAGKKIRSETGETLNKVVGNVDDAAMRDFSEDLYQAGARAIKTGEETASAFSRKASKMDPFETYDLEQSINKNFDEILAEKLGTNPSFEGIAQNLLDPANAALRQEIRESSLRAAREYNSRDISKVLFSKWRGVLGDTGGQIAGDVAYEAALLGIHGGLRNLSEKGWTWGLDLNDENYGRRSFVSDVWHGMLTGALLAPTRYIPGGAKVEIDPTKGAAGFRSGILANIKMASQSVIRNFNRKKATDFTPMQLQTMMRNIYMGSGRNKEFFRGVTGATEKLVLDPRMLENASNVKALQALYKRVSQDVTRLPDMLIRESARDLFYSFPRYVTGSVAMNAQNWLHNWEHTTPDQVITDFVVGAFYMKRGKVLEGKPPMKRFLGSTDIKGNEIADLARSFDVLNLDRGKLDYAAGTWNKIYEDHLLANNIVQRGNETSPDIRKAHDILEKDLIPAVDVATMLKQDKNLRDWASEIHLEHVRLLAVAGEARKAGRESEAKRLELEASNLLSKKDVAEILINELNYGVVDRAIRPMKKQEAIDFVDRLNQIELNGKRLTLDNVQSEIQTLRKAASYKTTSQLQRSMEDYIKESLNAFGLWDASMDTQGTIRVHPSTKDLLLSKLAANEKLSEYSVALQTLHDVLIMAERTGLIRFDQSALEWISNEGNQAISKDKLDRINAEYRINTERMHDLIAGTKDSGWRDLVPGRRTDNQF